MNKVGKHPEALMSRCAARVAAGETVAVVAKDEGVSISSIYNYRKKKGKLKRQVKKHVFTDLPVASQTEAHLVETAAGGKYMVIICDLTSLKQLAASL